MRKEVGLLFFALLVVLVFSSVYNINADTITGEAITGNATSASVAITITITDPPTLSILKPENETYFTDTNLELNFTALNADTIKYNLDNGTNTTITGNTTFNTTSGSHTLYLFANNSNGNATKNVTFTANLTRFTVIYNNYSNNGSSTNLNASSFENIQNLSDVILEKTAHGKIEFSTTINLTNDSTYTDNNLNLDIYTNISSNFIEINTTALPNFNKSATLSLYNLTFTNPRVLRNGEVCSDSICTEVSYSGGTFIFNVTQFTNYSAGETPSEETPSGGGGGSGGGNVSSIKSFRVNVDQIAVKLKQGAVETRNIVITNNLNQRLSIKIETQKLENFLLIRETEFSLNPGESKTISLDFIARITDTPELYLGKILVKEDGTEQKIEVILEIESKDILLDVYTEIPSISKKVLPGGELLTEVRIFNLGAFRGAKDIRIEYKIRDLDGNEIFGEHETIAIETQTSFIKKMHIPENMEYGNYILYIRAIYNSEVASASARFEVISPIITAKEKLFIVIIIILSVVLSLIIYLTILHQRRAHGKTIGRREEAKVDLRKIMKR